MIYLKKKLFSYRSPLTSKCGKNINEAHEPQVIVSLMFLTTFSLTSSVIYY